MDWFKKRSSEASTYGGLAMMIFGLGQAFKINEAPAIAEAVGNAGAAVAGGSPWWLAAGIAALGALGVLKSDGDKGF